MPLLLASEPGTVVPLAPAGRRTRSEDPNKQESKEARP